MLHGHNIVGFETCASKGDTLTSFSTIKGEVLPGEFAVATSADIELALTKATTAFATFSKTAAVERAIFLEAIATSILELGDELLERAHLETGLPLARLTGERERTMNQLRMFATLLREGSWVDAVIDTAQPDRKPLPRADLRRLLQPIGPVLVFGASNFPFAFSTAGGDTAAALAAGCPVIVKAHSSHLGTNEMVATAIQSAAKATGMVDGVFSSLNGDGANLGQRLATDPAIHAIGFTGSYKAGMALYKAATQERKVPIPVYAEMSSINPVVLLPNHLSEKGAATATALTASITLGVGQFCTNPGLLFVIDDSATEAFIEALTAGLAASAPAVMLNKGICKSYYEGRSIFEKSPGITTLFEGSAAEDQYKGSPALWKVSAADFIQQPKLQQEVFGPCSLLVLCKDEAELTAAVQSLEGQLTASVYGSAEELPAFEPVIEILKHKVGRVIFNAAPTGVEVCHAMVHGGPFPATTDARTTSVGTEAIRRFVRPVCFQDCPEILLPPALKNENPGNLMRKLNGVLTRDAVVE